jgi:protein tyrosine kinase modulator
VFVDTSTALKPVLEGLAVSSDTDAQVALVREALLSRPNLETVAKKTNLDAGIKNPNQLDSLILKLQTDLKVTSAAVRGASQNVFTITYMNRHRDTAVAVVRTLLDDFVEGTLTGSRTGSDEARGFLRAQISEYERRLSEAEARLADFKKKNVGLIPGERGDYFARLDAEMNALRVAENNVAVAESRRAALRAQLTSVQPYLPGTSAAPGPGPSLNATPDVSLRVQEAEARLEELLLKYTDKHPEVVALKATIAELKQREAQELAALSHGGAGTGAIRSLSANPVFQSVQMQLNQTDVELAALHGAITQHHEAIGELKRVVDMAPEVEQEYARLNRDYGATKAQYDGFVKRLEQAKVSDDAAKAGTIKFSLIEPPQANFKPLWPNRPLLIVLGLFGGIAAGIGVAVLMHLLSPTFHDALRLATQSGLRVLGSISRFRSSDEQRSYRGDVLRFAGAALFLVIACGSLVIFGNVGARMVHAWLA